MYTNGYIKDSFVVDLSSVGLLYNKIRKQISGKRQVDCVVTNSNPKYNKRKYIIIPIDQLFVP